MGTSSTHEDIIGENFQCNDGNIDGIQESELFCLEQEKNESVCVKESMSNSGLIVCEQKGWKDGDSTTVVKSKEVNHESFQDKDGIGKQEATASSNIETQIMVKEIDIDNLPEEAGEDACDSAEEFYGLSSSMQEVTKISSHIPDDMNSIVPSGGDKEMIVDEKWKHHTLGNKKDITKDLKENCVLWNKDNFIDSSVQLINVADCSPRTEESVKDIEVNLVDQQLIQLPLENEKTAEKDDDCSMCEGVN